MGNVYDLTGKDVEGREYRPVVFEGGLDQETSRFVVQPGTLSDCLNYNASTKGYTRAQGLWYYDGTIDQAVHNMWFVGVTDSESTFIGTGFPLGSTATWGDSSSGTVVYYERVLGATNYTMLGLVDISGPVPVDGDVVTEATTLTQWTLTGPMTYPPATLATAQNPLTGAYIANTVTSMLAFLNDTVNDRLVSQTDVVAAVSPSTFKTYHGAVPGIGAITGGWQFENQIYVTRDSYGVSFTDGDVELIPGDDVLVELSGGGTERACVAYTVLTSGNWAQRTAAGWVVFKPSASTADFRALVAPDTALGHITDLTAVNMATMRDTVPLRKGLVWRGTVNGWEWVDTGWTIDYDTGTTAPNVRAAPLFISDLVDSQRTTGPLPVGVGTSEGAAPYVAWTSPNNVLADDATNADVALTAASLSQYLKCTIPANSLPQDDLTILGITVELEAHCTGASRPVDSDIRLVNAATGATFYRSASRSRRESLIVATPTVYTYGSGSDTWGVEDISAEDINDGNVSIWIQYSNTGVGTALVDYVTFDITYIPKTEKVWFRDGLTGVTDFSTGVIHAFQIESGSFSAPSGPTDDAAGTMSLMDVSSPQDIGVGMEMCSDATPDGVVIAQVASVPRYNLFPSRAEMVTADSQCQTIIQNYYDNDESEAIYGVTGAAPAFTFDGESFAYLQTPLARSVDKPRQIAFHDNRLAIGFQPGTVVLSAVGTPNDFSGVDGASAWGVGDRVTGLMSMPGSVLGVFSESSIRSLEGSDAEEGAMRTISPTSGCRQYTMQNIVGPYFADNRGISNLEASQNYGDFDLMRSSDPVRVWLQERLQDTVSVRTVETRPVASVAVRNKNQYRLYFADGWVLVLYFGLNGKIAPTFMHYETSAYASTYVPTFINSTVLTTGKERIVMGTEAGDVWIVDGAELIQTPDGPVTPSCYLVTNPTNFGAPDKNHKQYHVVVQGQFFAAQTVDAWGDTNYVFEETGAAQYSTVFGSYDNTPIFTSKNEIDSIYLPILADGFSMKLQTSMDGSAPHTFQSLLYRASPKGMDRNRVSKTY